MHQPSRAGQSIAREEFAMARDSIAKADTTTRTNWVSIVLAVIAGPLWIILVWNILGRRGGIYGAAVHAFFLFSIVIIPLLTLLPTQRWKILTWQVAVCSFSLAMFVQNLGSSPVNDGALALDIRLWVVTSVLSSPLPIYFLLRQLTPKKRIIVGIAIAAAIVTFFLNYSGLV